MKQQKIDFLNAFITLWELSACDTDEMRDKLSALFMQFVKDNGLPVDQSAEEILQDLNKSLADTKETKHGAGREFLVVDNSGRGHRATMSIDDLVTWDWDEMNDDLEMSLGEFLHTSELGDKFETEDNSTITRTK